MRKWAAALVAFRYSVAVHLIFIEAFTEEEAREKAYKACLYEFPVNKGFKDHVYSIRDTQPMNDEVRFIHEWDKK